MAFQRVKLVIFIFKDRYNTEKKTLLRCKEKDNGEFTSPLSYINRKKQQAYACNSCLFYDFYCLAICCSYHIDTKSKLVYVHSAKRIYCLASAFS